ncbi:MAG: PhoU domain-containing protein [Myxococcales bacterium]|jgi:phosphate uptake regulator/aminoglycoside phosphotransferase (APT) family kinase protein
MLSMNVEDNLRFLIREVQKQLRRTELYIKQPTRQLRRSLLSRDNYIDNLRVFIQRAVFGIATDSPQLEYLKAIDVISVNLERMADFCEDIVGQLDHVPHQDVLEQQDFSPFFEEVNGALELVEEAVLEKNVHRALRICRAEPTLDDLFGEAMQRGISALRTGKKVETHATLLFIWHYFERMGDSLLNIGEAVISASLGEKIKIGQLWALEDSLEDLDQSLDEVELESLGESRSGCHIARVSERDAEDIDGTAVIFKEGQTDKLEQERRGIERWEKLVPGLAPKVFSFHENGRNGAMLLEYIPGQTFEQLLLTGQASELGDALSRICAMLEHVWDTTRTDERVAAGFSSQLQKRLGDLFAVHPAFSSEKVRIGALAVPPFEQLVARAVEQEARLAAPFSVLSHGDFNVDNVIYNPETARLRLIDLHRARGADYLQDVSVFMVSNFRLQIFEAPVRRRINEVILRFCEFARDYAAERGDGTFEARLGFGLARSYASSARFILDEKFARMLFLRARFLFEHLVRLDEAGLRSFVLPKEILVD